MMVKIGIVGAGLRGRLFERALRSQRAEVVGFAEPSKRVAELAGNETGVPVYDSHLALLEAEDPDAFIVATPDFAHRDVAVELASRGKHLLIEKPLATSLEDAEAIYDAVTSAGVRSLVGFENRWNPHVVKAKELIDRGALGRPISAGAVLSNSYSVPLEMLSWAAKSSPAWFLMPHSVDLLVHLLGQKPVTVQAMSSRGELAARGVDTRDAVHALLRFEDGAIATLTSVWTLPDARESIVDFNFSIVGTEGSVSADLTHQGLTTVTDKYRSEWPLEGRIGTAEVGMAAWMAQQFAAGLESGEEFGPGVEHGLLVTRVICAIEESADSGQPVVVGG